MPTLRTTAGVLLCVWLLCLPAGATGIEPSEVVVPGLLDGRQNVIKLTRQWLSYRRSRLAVASDRRAAGT